jgi:ABC-2 type transport system ATP-binding protein
VVELAEVLTTIAAGGTTVLFSSHQLDLVQDLCDRIALIAQGRLVVEGSVAQLRSSWGRRQLRLAVVEPEGADDAGQSAAGPRAREPGAREWWAAFPGVRVVEHNVGRLLLALPVDVDPLQVLDAARNAGRVLDFGLELPNLSEIFQTVVEKRAPGRSEAEDLGGQRTRERGAR